MNMDKLRMNGFVDRSDSDRFAISEGCADVAIIRSSRAVA
jgi:hypothetical protein